MVDCGPPPSCRRGRNPSARRDIGFPFPRKLLHLFSILVCENVSKEIEEGIRLQNVTDGFGLWQADPLLLKGGLYQ